MNHLGTRLLAGRGSQLASCEEACHTPGVRLAQKCGNLDEQQQWGQQDQDQPRDELASWECERCSQKQQAEAVEASILDHGKALLEEARGAVEAQLAQEHSKLEKQPDRAARTSSGCMSPRSRGGIPGEAA